VGKACQQIRKRTLKTLTICSVNICCNLLDYAYIFLMSVLCFFITFALHMIILLYHYVVNKDKYIKFCSVRSQFRLQNLINDITLYIKFA